VFQLAEVQVIHREVPIAQPVKTSFAAMNSRHAVLLVAGDGAGRRGDRL